MAAIAGPRSSLAGGSGALIWAVERLTVSTSEGAFGTGANSARIARFRPYEIRVKTKMSMPVGVDLSIGPESLGVLAFRGADAARFLQGQLSADTEKLAPGASTLAGLHNAQGRVVALLAMTRAAPDAFLAALPRELVSVVAQRLTKYLFRAKVSISDESEAWRVLGASAGATPAGSAAVSWGDRRLLLVPRTVEPDEAGITLADWLRIDVAAGLPQIFSATSESFVAQMLNLDLLGAIAFDKGCYTGQEVIARAHYRGRVKRRLQRWHHASESPLKPAAAARSADGRALTVVRVAPANSGGYEVLAIGAFGAREDAAGSDAEHVELATLDGPFPLPYTLPE
jgi:tRNA-modifying protein YgfZ